MKPKPFKMCGWPEYDGAEQSRVIVYTMSLLCVSALLWLIWAVQP